ncbi:MAG: hypothetical protein C9356_01080 [Oleiphilus sp.]|nr:MAG: hypothetical protein C9356_01080 [Oleiphilus sp.]
MQFLEENIQAFDGTSLNVYRWLPDEAKAAILISHGWSEHAGRYGDLAHWFAEQGYEVHAYDHRGHGKSGGLRGHVRRWDDYVQDLELVRNTIAQEQQYLLGHSMGGLIAVRYLLTHQSNFRAVALSGPGLDVSYPVPLVKVLLSKALSALWPTLRFDGEVDPQIVCGKTEVVEAYQHDPFNHGKVSARWFVEYLRAVAMVKDGAQSLVTPIAIWHGEKDALVEPWVSQQFFGLMRGEHKQYQLLPDLLHEILFEDNWQDTAGQIKLWFEQF